MLVGAIVLLTVSCSPYKYETVKGDPLETITPPLIVPISFVF